MTISLTSFLTPVPRCLNSGTVSRPSLSTSSVWRKWFIAFLFFSEVFGGIAYAASAQVSWQEKSQAVCLQLTMAATAYAKNDLAAAHTNALMAYFQQYDLNIEPTARLHFDQGHIFSIEQAFNHLNTQMVSPVTPAEISLVQAQAKALCQVIMNDAKIMDAQHLLPQP